MIMRSCLVTVIALLSWSPLIGQTDNSLPANTGAINVVDLGARGDDDLNDEKIIEKAIRDYHDARRQFYLPPGTYYVSGTLGDMDSLGGINGYDRFYTLRGAGRGRTIIKLRNGSAGFQDSANPKPVVLCWNRQVLVDRPIPYEGVEEGNPDESNDCHSVHVVNLTIDVGDNNPGAIGLDFTAHNGGGVENVEIKAGTGSGKIGLALNRKWPGPALVNNISITGFDYGIHLRYHNYNMVLENITLQSQRILGILHENHAASIRKVTSTNSVPAVRNIGLQGMLVLMDCVFQGGSSGVCAVENSHGLFARNVVTKGYQSALKNGGAVVSSIRDTIREFISEPWHCALTQSPRRSLGLAVKETPEVPWGTPSLWVNIETYQSSVVAGDWAPAFRAAIQAGPTTVYLPNRGRYQTYAIKQPVRINGNLRRLMGLSSTIGGGKLVFDQTDASAVVVLDQVWFDSLEHKSPATLILKRCLGSNIRTFPGSGDLFIEDICGSNMVFDHSSVWARQLNNESRDIKLQNKGGKLWILGYKTENPTTVLTNSDSAQTEILGGQNYPVFKVNDTIPMFINIESALSVIQTYNHYYIPDEPKYPYFAKEIYKGVTRRVDSTVAPFTSYPRLNRIIYVSNPDSVGQGSPSTLGSLTTGTKLPGQGKRTTVRVRNGTVVVDPGSLSPFEVLIINADGRIVRSIRSAGSRGPVLLKGPRLARGIYCIDVRSAEAHQVERLYLGR